MYSKYEHILVSLVYVVGHGGLYLVLSKWARELLNSFLATLLAFSNVISDCMCSLLTSVSVNSAEQPAAEYRLARSFSKMTHVLRQCLFWG